MITKTGGSLLNTAGRFASKDLITPTNMALGSFLVASGSNSVGEAAGITTGGLAGMKAYNAFSKKYLPKAMALAGKAPGIWGKAAKGLVGAGNLVAGFTSPMVPASIGASIGKKVPIYKRKNPLPANVQA